jgi:hypothetical protein
MSTNELTVDEMIEKLMFISASGCGGHIVRGKDLGSTHNFSITRVYKDKKDMEDGNEIITIGT